MILALGLVAAFLAGQAYFGAPEGVGNVVDRGPLQQISGAIARPLRLQSRKRRTSKLSGTAAASVDEELDYMVARRLGSLEGWSAFLAAHGSGAYAPSARAEVERLLLAQKASAPPAAEVSNGVSPDTETESKAVRPAQPSPGTQVAALAPDEVPALAARELSNAASPDAKRVDEAPVAALPSSGTEASALATDEVCKRDGDRLARLRGNFSSDEAFRFANELGCEQLRPQLLALIESSAARFRRRPRRRFRTARPRTRKPPRIPLRLPRGRKARLPRLPRLTPRTRPQ